MSQDYIWAPNRKGLNDPCEGIFLIDEIESQLQLINQVLLGDANPEALQKVKDSLNSVYAYIDKFGIYSLSKTPHEELLWAHYADSHKGFCIEYELEKLIEFENDFATIQVQYESAPKSVNISHLEKSSKENILNVMIGTKSSSWSYEKEIRVVTSQYGKHCYDYRAVKNIYFGLLMDDSEKDQVMLRLKGRGINYHQVYLEEGSFKFSSRAIDDKYKEAPKYLYSIAPIQEKAIDPDYVHANYEQYISYLYKAAEIVRREPYCDLVEMVEFSASKGSPENPIVFVQYKRHGEKWVTHYLSISEIDELYQNITDIETTSHNNQFNQGRSQGCAH